MAQQIKGNHGGGTLNVLQKGETANPNGRPRKSIASVNNELKELGYTPAKAVDVTECYMLLLNLDKDQLTSLTNNNTAPMLQRIVAKSILQGKGLDIVEKMLDRVVGKPKQQTEITGADGGAVEFVQIAVAGRTAHLAAKGEELQKTKQNEL